MALPKRKSGCCLHDLLTEGAEHQGGELDVHVEIDPQLPLKRFGHQGLNSRGSRVAIIPIIEQAVEPRRAWPKKGIGEMLLLRSWPPHSISPPELHEQVRRIAAAERGSITQTLIVASEGYVKRHQRSAEVEVLSARIAEEDAELLRRLA